MKSLTQFPMEKEKNKKHLLPASALTKEFLNQFTTESDVSSFLKDLHAQMLEHLLESEMDVHLGYEKNSTEGNNSGNFRNGNFPKTVQTEHGRAQIRIPRDRNGAFEPIVVPKHESTDLSIEKLVISLTSFPCLIPCYDVFKSLRLRIARIQTVC